MRRTCNRPIVKGDISPESALFISIFLISLGLIIILLKFKFLPFLLSFLAFFIYIFVYTPLKKVTSFAFFTWFYNWCLTSAYWLGFCRGYIFSPTIVSVSFYFFMWQMPHFMLLSYIMSDDYKKAGLKTIGDVFSEKEVKIIILNSVAGTLLFTLSFPLFGVTRSKNFLLFSIFTIFL